MHFRLCIDGVFREGSPHLLIRTNFQSSRKQQHHFFDCISNNCTAEDFPVRSAGPELIQRIRNDMTTSLRQSIAPTPTLSSHKFKYLLLMVNIFCLKQV